MGIFLVLILLGTCTNAFAAEPKPDHDEKLENFIEDIIRTWNLLSPTLVVDENIPAMCFSHERVLCLQNGDTDIAELTQHLTVIHEGRKQDGMIFVGAKVHEQLLKHMEDTDGTSLLRSPSIANPLESISHPSFFRTNSPVFMPQEYSHMMTLRLDSNIIFYEEVNDTAFELVDIFAVGGGPAIKLKLGMWGIGGGEIKLQSSMSRWDRRRDLKGAPFVNSIMVNGHWADFTRDDEGNITGSKGYTQEMLFYIIDSLNLTVKTVEYQGGWKLLENGSWTGGRGQMQRKEADTFSAGMGIQLKYCFEDGIFDCPIPVVELPSVLFAGKPTGAAPNMWVYVNVFGVTQWLFFLLALIVMVVGFSIINFFSREESAKTPGADIGSNIASVFLYTIQMGDHPSTKQRASSVLSIVLSFLTLLMMIYYANDITAKMTAGPGEHPVKNFEDVLHHGYSVVVGSGYYSLILGSSPKGSAKLKVYEMYLEPIKEEISAGTANLGKGLEEITTDSKVLLYGGTSLSQYEVAKPYVQRIQMLNTDDNYLALASFILHKDSEFLPVFNHYIIKAFETGIFKRLFRSYHPTMYTNEEFGMLEPEALGANNVMFTSIGLVCGISAAMTIACIEFVTKKIFGSKKSPPASTAWSATVEVEEAEEQES